MGRVLLYFSVLLLAGVMASAEDFGGLTARLIPEEVKPGDLFVLSVEMRRADFGEFTLEVPSHPGLHLVSREKIPLSVVDGQYHQGERLMLQALASGAVNLSGIKAELTESTGSRVVELPELGLKVTAFETEDLSEVPEPLPVSKDDSQSRTALIVNFILLAGIALLTYIICRPRTDSGPGESDGSLVPDLTKDLDLEMLLNEQGESLSPELRSDLERFIYSKNTRSGDDTGLLIRLREELGQ